MQLICPRQKITQKTREKVIICTNYVNFTPTKISGSYQFRVDEHEQCK